MQPRIASDDYYAVLGVSRSATPRQIHRAYRALARKHHPDLNPDDPAAADKFREVQNAYEVLGDPRKRKAYDYYGASFGTRVPLTVVDLKQEQKGAARDKRPDTGARTATRTGTIGPFPPSWGSGVPGVSRYRLGSLTVAAVFVIGMLIYLLLPKNGGRNEFLRSQQALRNVRSWKMQAADLAGGSYLDEVECPSSERTTQHLRVKAPGRATELTLETVNIGSEQYIYSDMSGNWTRSSGHGNVAAACVEVSGGEDARLLPRFAEWLNGRYVMKKGKVRRTSDGDCREWSVTQLGGFSARPVVEVVCLGVKDHLPMFYGTPDVSGEVHFYDWNVPIGIQAPADVASLR